MALTLAQAQTSLDLWVTASESLAKGKEVSMGDRTLTHANAEEVVKMITFWERKVASLSGYSGPSRATWNTQL